MDAVLGTTFGSSFKMKKGIKNNVHDLDKVSPEILLTRQAECIDIESGLDNRNLNDDGTSQKLSREEISSLISSATSGKEVVQTLTENSKTFKDKTKFSQEKYLKKKQRKYDELVTIHAPSVRLLCDMYYIQDPMQVCNLRIDSLAQLLSYSNVQAGGRYAVFEDGTKGLVTAAMLQRMGTQGNLVQLNHKGQPQRQTVDLMNLTAQEMEVLSFLHIGYLPNRKIANEDTTNGEIRKQEAENEKMDEESKVDERLEGPSDECMMEEQNQDEEVKRNVDPTKPRRWARNVYKDRALSAKVLLGGIEGLVIAGRSDPKSVFLGLFEYLKPGFPFVIFSPYKESLVDAYMTIKNAGGSNLKLSETWLRQYQVLPHRTHPEVNMSGGGGYLLCGVKVCNQI
ncbi:unnamed protein product [Meganyctiphanes norvegica]|uniref:tRNA (adenine(58)-N(1))-methyltransferase non-catalytic subunit TRM6 n=1 Tax=Meganyctiphanes norvegica TaxID=48144 RepID=A0AAV2PWT6_MEGNR